jgi:two-component system, LuxR family, sensor kinase FixL
MPQGLRFSDQGDTMVADQAPNEELMSEIILRDILETVNDAVITVDVHHHIRFFNAKAEEVFGYRRDEVLGQDLRILLISRHQNEHHGFLQRYLGKGGPSVLGRTIECTGRRKDGNTFPLEKSYSYHEADGQPYFTAVIRDVSAKRELEQQLRFAERHADVGKAITHVVHEIRNPLMLIGGFARQLTNNPGIQGDAKNLQKLQIIVDEVRRLEELLEGVLLLRRPASAARKCLLDVCEVMRETTRLLEPRLAGRALKLMVQLPPRVVQIDGDPDQLKQVFLNLLQNALEAIEAAGTIRIEAETDAGMVRILIHDSGPGVPAELLGRIFDPFFTTKTHGTGLGLAISRNIIQDHGGSIRVECPIGRGTTFIIELPLAPGQSRSEAQDQASVNA